MPFSGGSRIFHTRGNRPKGEGVGTKLILRVLCGNFQDVDGCSY